MTTSHAILTMFAACSLLAAQASAQTVAAPAAPAAAPAPATAAGPGLKMAVALRGAAATGASTTTVHAAGGVLLLADGIVADARVAPVQPPAPGFQYEH